MFSALCSQDNVGVECRTKAETGELPSFDRSLTLRRPGANVCCTLHLVPVCGEVILQDLSIFESSGWQGDGSPPPTMTGQKMLRLSLRTWPFMRPILPHLLVLLAFAAAGALGSTLTFFVGTDLFTNKVLLGQKLQPLMSRLRRSIRKPKTNWWRRCRRQRRIDW